jgi:hypothetical protein
MKNLFFGLIAIVFTSISVNAQAAVPGFKTIKADFRQISSYAGPCISGPGFCGGLQTEPVSPTQAYMGIAKSSIAGKITVVFNEQLIREYSAQLSGGSIVIGRDYPLAQEVSEAIGFQGPFYLRAGSYRYAYENGYYYCTIN